MNDEDFIEVGWIERGVRGRYSAGVTLDASCPWIYREDEDEQPALVRLFAMRLDASTKGTT